MTEQTLETHQKGVFGWAGRHPRATFSIVILVILVTFTILFDISAKNKLSRQIVEARARGEPMSVADLNAARSGPPADANPAFILLNEAACFDCSPTVKLPEDKQKVLPIIGQPNPPPTGVPLPEEQLDALRWYFASKENELYPSPEQVDPSASAANGDKDAGRERTLQELRNDILKVLAEPGGLLEYQAVTPMVNTSMPELAQYRAICRFLSASCVRYLEQGEGPECLRDLRAQLALSRHLKAAYPSLIQALVLVANEARAVDMIERAVNHGALGWDEITTLEFELREIETNPVLRRAMMCERVTFLDAYEWTRSGGGLGVAAPGSSSALKFVPVLPSLDVSSGLDLYGQLIDATEEPVPNALKTSMDARIAAENLPAYKLFTRIMMPSLTRSVELWLRGVGSKRAMIAALACERFRLATGEWPESLTDLVPEYLKAVPVDPFDGAPIRYAVTAEGINVWCIGEDLRDDGGNIKRREKQTASNKPTDWGWLILNPDLRGKPMPQPTNSSTTSSPATQSAGH